jgi:eukaryotic-like serine/threonine-protein kinase
MSAAPRPALNGQLPSMDGLETMDVMTAPARIGPYRIERLLGAGSFATVWLALDPSLDAWVAIKLLADNWSHDLRVRERFLDEARLLWRLDSDRVIRVHGIGELPDGRPYTVMAWADGGSLRDRLAKGPMPADARLRLVREVAEGVAVLHDRGIVHRDLTPGNVLFRTVPGRPAQQVLIADLGLAKAMAAASGLTARAGTPGYMAPEQDDPLAVVDARCDVYGLGRLAIHLLAAPGGRLRLRPGVPPRVADVLRTATSLRPADRYRDAAAFGAAFDRAAAVSRRFGALRRGAVAAGLALVVAGAGTALAADSRPTTVSDPTGRLTATLPEGWRAKASTWKDRRAPDGSPEPAMVLSPDPGRWPSDPGVPGAFVGLSRGGAATPEEFVAHRTHRGCTARPVHTTRRGGIDWVVAGYTDCVTGKATRFEIAGAVPGGLVYVQFTPPADAGSGFVETLLGSVRVGTVRVASVRGG